MCMLRVCEQHSGPPAPHGPVADDATDVAVVDCGLHQLPPSRETLPAVPVADASDGVRLILLSAFMIVQSDVVGEDVLTCPEGLPHAPGRVDPSGQVDQDVS